MLDDRVAEKDFLADVKRLAQLTGWRTYHCLDSRGSDEGFVDLIVVRRGTLYGWELKTMRGKVTPAQAAWVEDLGCVTRVASEVLRPSDWLRIERMLKGEIA